MGWFFAFFVASGFSGLVYQVVWLRLCMAGFGVTTALISIVLSVFMAGLALGALGGGRLARRLPAGSPALPLRLYGLTEALIATSALAVPALLAAGRRLLLDGTGGHWGSGSWHLASGALIAAALLPFGILMGATFPLAMETIRRRWPRGAPRSFSFLYVANVLGAMAGTAGSSFVLLEVLGFSRTLLVAAAVNASVAALAGLLSLRRASRAPAAAPVATPAATAAAAPAAVRGPHGNRVPALAMVFLSGFASLALEVVWTRVYNPFLGPVVYSFGAMLTVYLAATTAGTWLYRSRARPDVPWPGLAMAAGVAALLVLPAAHPGVPLGSTFLAALLRVIVGIAPFCLLLGWLTPMLLDRLSGGDPARAGAAYALNTVGCILGPLAASFGLLPGAGEALSVVALAMPFVLLALAAAGPRLLAAAAAAAALAAILLAAGGDYAGAGEGAIVRRDHTATVVASGEGQGRRLLVNGYGMTHLTPITKMMAHLPLAHLSSAPRRGLVLCLGMGTSFRSMHSWGIDTTAVELVPSVPGLLGFYHADGDALLSSPRARIVVDDARRYVERTRETWDVVVVDPPPPVEAAGSSLLYSVEFLAAVRARLGPGGILAHWLPWGDAETVAAVTRALAESFPHLRVLKSVEGWGWHFLASGAPIPRLGATGLAARLPPAAAADLVEWGPARDPAEMFAAVLAREVPVGELLAVSPAPALADDRPVNEYFLLRRGGLGSGGLR